MTVEPIAPLRIGRVTLIVQDLGPVADFYQSVVGLHLSSADGESAALGDGRRVLLELRQDRAARRRSPGEAGLFHTAFLLPSRGDLGRWTAHVAALRKPVAGASDHLVSEAVYLTDPEGNGVEIYADRPAAGWRWRGGLVEMSTGPLDVPSLIASGGEGAWRGVPADTTVGHVHLQVGALEPAEAFYGGTLGLDVTCRYPGAIFFSSGGYHHHIAANVWNSRGASLRTPSTGLGDIEILATPAALASLGTALRQQGGGMTLLDPWGTPISIVG